MRILIVEDDENISNMTSEILRLGGYEPDTAFDGNDAEGKIIANDYALILLDVMLPGQDGYTVFEKTSFRNIPVIFLTALQDVTNKVKGLRLGADDYIVKPFEAVELLARIEAVLRRAGRAETAFRYGAVSLDAASRTVTVGGRAAQLTPKEFDLMLFFLKNPGIAISRERLLAEIWGYGFAGETRTVDNHVAQLRRKLGLQSSLVTVAKLGYRLERVR